MYDDHVHNHICRIHGGSIVGAGSLTFSHGEYEVSESGVVRAGTSKTECSGCLSERAVEIISINGALAVSQQ